MDKTVQLYIDKNRTIKGYPITSPERVVDENGKSVKEQLDEINAKIKQTNVLLNKIEDTVLIKNAVQMYKLTKDDGEINNNLRMLDLQPGNYSCIASMFIDPPIPGDTGYVDISVRQNSNSVGTRKIIIVHYIYQERIFVGQKHGSCDYIEWKEFDFKRSNGCV